MMPNCGLVDKHSAAGVFVFCSEKDSRFRSRAFALFFCYSVLTTVNSLVQSELSLSQTVEARGCSINEAPQLLHVSSLVNGRSNSLHSQSESSPN